MNYEIPLIGLMLTFIFISVTGIYPGGLIVPGYLALYADTPERLAGTFAASLIALFFYKFASNQMILFGKRRFVFMILSGAIASYLISALLPSLFPGTTDFRVVGWIIPGLIANNMERQGIPITAGALIIMITAVYFITKLYFAI